MLEMILDALLSAFGQVDAPGAEIWSSEIVAQGAESWFDDWSKGRPLRFVTGGPHPFAPAPLEAIS